MKTFITILLLQLSLLAAVSIGQKAPDFTLLSLNSEQTHSLKEFQNKIVLLNIWASWCGGCKHEMPELIKLQNDYASKLQIVAVNIDRNTYGALKFLREIEENISLADSFVNLHDPKKTIPKLYSCIGMPSSYLIDKHGVIRDIIIGSLDAEGIKTLKKEIDEMDK